MVSFVCNYCQDTIKKPKLDQHFNRCPNASFSCVDCSTDFYGTDYRSHTTCISEAEKYQGALYKGAKKDGQQNGQKQQQQRKATNKQQVEKKVTNGTSSVPKSIIDELKATTISGNNDKRKLDELKVEESNKKKSKTTADTTIDDTIKALVRKTIKKEKEITLKSLYKKLVKKVDPSLDLDKETLEKRLSQMIKLSLKDDQIVLTL